MAKVFDADMCVQIAKYQSNKNTYLISDNQRQHHPYICHWKTYDLCAARFNDGMTPQFDDMDDDIYDMAKTFSLFVPKSWFNVFCHPYTRKAFIVKMFKHDMTRAKKEEKKQKKRRLMGYDAQTTPKRRRRVEEDVDKPVPVRRVKSLFFDDEEEEENQPQTTSPTHNIVFLFDLVFVKPDVSKISLAHKSMIFDYITLSICFERVGIMKDLSSNDMTTRHAALTILHQFLTNVLFISIKMSKCILQPLFQMVSSITLLDIYSAVVGSDVFKLMCSLYQPSIRELNDRFRCMTSKLDNVSRLYALNRCAAVSNTNAMFNLNSRIYMGFSAPLIVDLLCGITQRPSCCMLEFHKQYAFPGKKDVVICL